MSYLDRRLRRAEQMLSQHGLSLDDFNKELPQVQKEESGIHHPQPPTKPNRKKKKTIIRRKKVRRKIVIMVSRKLRHQIIMMF